MSENNTMKPYSKAIVSLLKGTVERSSPIWNDILIYQGDIENYIAVIGLTLIIKKDEGFAFVKQIEQENGTTLNLVSRRQIGFEASIVLVVLRQILEEFDSNPIETQSFDKLIKKSEIEEEIELFLPERYNKVKFNKELNSYIGTAEKLGFLKEVKKTEKDTIYKIHRIIKEKITLNDLQEFKLKLQEYV